MLVRTRRARLVSVPNNPNRVVEYIRSTKGPECASELAWGYGSRARRSPRESLPQTVLILGPVRSTVRAHSSTARTLRKILVHVYSPPVQCTGYRVDLLRRLARGWGHTSTSWLYITATL